MLCCQSLFLQIVYIYMTVLSTNDFNNYRFTNPGTYSCNHISEVCEKRFMLKTPFIERIYVVGTN